MTNKLLAPTLETIQKINATTTYRLEVDNELLNGYDVAVEKSDNGFTASIHFKPSKGFSSTELNSIKLPLPIRLYNNTAEYFVAENSMLFNQYTPDFNSDDLSVIVNGSIGQISTAEDDSMFNDRYLRLVIPIKGNSTKLRELRDIRGWSYEADITLLEKQLIKVIVNGIEYHFFSFKIANATYLAVDTTEPFNVKDFRRLSHSILLGFGFLFDDLFLDEGYIISATAIDFAEVQNVNYSPYRESLLTGLRIYTTNPYSVYNVTGKTREEIDARVAEIKAWYEKVVEVKPELFSKLCELFYNIEPISRAAMITLQGNQLALEIKGSTYSAALEAITSIILKENKTKYPKPVDDKVVFTALKTRFFDALDELLPDTPENETVRIILTTRINEMNKPTNASKLKKSFEVLGHELQPYEFEALKARDKFQHGDLPVVEITDDNVFREVYYICLVLHRLIYVLILRRIGFDGHIINYPQLHSHITGRDLGEDSFYKISV